MPRRAKGPRLYLRGRKGRSRTWVIRDGRRETSTGCGTQDLVGAEKHLAAYLTARHRPQTASTRPADLFIADVLNVYLTEHAPHVANPEFIRYTARPILDWWGDKTLAAIRGVTCRQYVDWRIAQDVSTQTARHDLKTLRAAVNYYHREYGPLDAVPAFTIPPKAKPKVRWLTRPEAARLLWAARRHVNIRRLILLGIYTGTRSGAMRSLKWTVALRGGWIDIENGILYRSGQADRETKKGQKPCSIPDRLLPHLRRWRAWDTARNIGTVVHYKGQPQKKVKTAWKTVLKAAGLGSDVTPHTLRHTATTWLLLAGVDPWQVAGFVDMSLETLMKTYGHHAVSHQKGATRARLR